MRQAGWTRQVLVAVMCAGWTVACGVAAAEEKGQTQAAPSVKPSSAAPVAQPTTTAKSPQEKRQEEMLAALNGSSWELELRPFEAGEKKPKILKDTVTFKGATVTSERLGKLGYGSSNFSLNVKEDGTATWETMQSKAGEGTAFWRGEVDKDKMRGVLSQQPTGAAAENFTFVGTRIGKPEQSTAQPIAAPQPSAADPAATSSGQRAQQASAPGVVASPKHAPSAPAQAAEASRTDKKKEGWF